MKEEKPNDKDMKDNGSGRIDKVKRTLADYLNERINKLSAAHRKFSESRFNFFGGESGRLLVAACKKIAPNLGG